MRSKDERGSAVAQLTILVPALMLIVMLVVQFALVFHARNVAEQAAQEGTAQARKFDGTAAAGEAKARELLNTARGTLKDSKASVTRSTTTASATVTGRVVSVVPFLRLHVSETATGPVERYVPMEDAAS